MARTTAEVHARLAGSLCGIGQERTHGRCRRGARSPPRGGHGAQLDVAAERGICRSREMSATPNPDLRTGAQILCEALVRQGVDVIFGIPGGAIMPFYHALPEYSEQLHHVLCRHEQGAGHPPEGYAPPTGRVAVCLPTTGPR